MTAAVYRVMFGNLNEYERQAYYILVSVVSVVIVMMAALALIV